MNSWIMCIHNNNVRCSVGATKCNNCEIDNVYQKGRVDALGETVIPLSNLNEHDAKVRADVINKIEKHIDGLKSIGRFNYESIKSILKQMKEDNDNNYQHYEHPNEEFFECQAEYLNGTWCQ